MADIPQRLTIVTLGVADLGAAKEFYLNGLGWTEVDQDSDGIVFMQMAAMALALYPHAALAEDIGFDAPAHPGGYTGVTLAYNTSSDEETDRVLAAAVAAGASLVKEAEKVFWGGYSGYFSDPDGHLWEVAHNPFTLPTADGAFHIET